MYTASGCRICGGDKWLEEEHQCSLWCVQEKGGDKRLEEKAGERCHPRYALFGAAANEIKKNGNFDLAGVLNLKLKKKPRRIRRGHKRLEKQAGERCHRCVASVAETNGLKKDDDDKKETCEMQLDKTEDKIGEDLHN